MGCGSSRVQKALGIGNKRDTINSFCSKDLDFFGQFKKTDFFSKNKQN